MVIDSEKDSIRPYTPPSNVISVLGRIRSRNLPEIIDAEYLRDASIPEGTITRTLLAMKFLGLIKEGNELSDQLKAIHTSTDEEYKTILSGLIRESYKEVFNVIDPTQDSQDKILNFFRRYTPASQRSRMVIFFLGMCREAGIPTLDVPKARAMGVKTGKPESRNTGSSEGRYTRSDRTLKNNHTIFSVNPAIEGLMKTLPEPGEELSKERRTQWLKMAEATLQFLYPEKTNDDTGPDGEAEQK